MDIIDYIFACMHSNSLHASLKWLQALCLCRLLNLPLRPVSVRVHAFCADEHNAQWFCWYLSQHSANTGLCRLSMHSTPSPRLNNVVSLRQLSSRQSRESDVTTIMYMQTVVKPAALYIASHCCLPPSPQVDPDLLALVDEHLLVKSEDG